MNVHVQFLCSKTEFFNVIFFFFYFLIFFVRERESPKARVGRGGAEREGESQASSMLSIELRNHEIMT